MDLQEVGCGCMNRSGSGQGQLAGICECGNEPSGSIKCGNFLTSCEPVSLSRRTVLCGVSKVCLLSSTSATADSNPSIFLNDSVSTTRS